MQTSLVLRLEYLQSLMVGQALVLFIGQRAPAAENAALLVAFSIMDALGCSIFVLIYGIAKSNDGQRPALTTVHRSFPSLFEPLTDFKSSSRASLILCHGYFFCQRYESKRHNITPPGPPVDSFSRRP